MELEAKRRPGLELRLVLAIKQCSETLVRRGNDIIIYVHDSCTKDARAQVFVIVGVG